MPELYPAGFYRKIKSVAIPVFGNSPYSKSELFQLKDIVYESQYMGLEAPVATQ